MSGSRGLAFPRPFLGAPAGPRGTYWGHGVRGLSSPDPLLGANQWCANTTECRPLGSPWRFHSAVPGPVVPVAVGKPVEIPQEQFLDKLLLPLLLGSPWRFHRCSSWTSCPCPLLVRGADGQTENCGYAAVAVQIVTSRATGRGEIVEVIQLLRRGVD